MVIKPDQIPSLPPILPLLGLFQHISRPWHSMDDFILSLMTMRLLCKLQRSGPDGQERSRNGAVLQRTDLFGDFGVWVALPRLYDTGITHKRHVEQMMMSHYVYVIDSIPKIIIMFDDVILLLPWLRIKAVALYYKRQELRRVSTQLSLLSSLLSRH